MAHHLTAPHGGPPHGHGPGHVHQGHGGHGGHTHGRRHSRQGLFRRDDEHPFQETLGLMLMDIENFVMQEVESIVSQMGAGAGHPHSQEPAKLPTDETDLLPTFSKQLDDENGSSFAESPVGESELPSTRTAAISAASPRSISVVERARTYGTAGVNRLRSLPGGAAAAAGLAVGHQNSAEPGTPGRTSRPSMFGRVSAVGRKFADDEDTELKNERRTRTITEIIGRMRSTDCLSFEDDNFASFWVRFRTDRALQQLIFDAFMGAFIVLNAIIIGVSADLYPDWKGWTIIDAVFALLFAQEMVVKLCYLGVRDYLVGPDRVWNLFEAVMVFLGIFEAAVGLFANGDSGQNLSLFRIMRLARITRLLRVCRLQIFAQLMVMIKGSLGGIKTLFWATILICLPLYAIAIFFRETIGKAAVQGYGSELFKNVPTSFFTLFRCIVSGECTDFDGQPIFAHIADRYGWGYGFVYCVVDLLMTFGLFNVIVAIFIENVLARTKTNAQIMKRERLRDKQFFADKMAELCEVIVEIVEHKKCVFPGAKALVMSTAEVELTPDHLEELRQHPRFIEIFHDLAISDEDTLDLFETLDADDSGTIDMGELFDGIARLRGEARRSDVVAINFMIQKLQNDLAVMGKRSEASLRHVTTQLCALTDLTEANKRNIRRLTQTASKTSPDMEALVSSRVDFSVPHSKAIEDVNASMPDSTVSGTGKCLTSL